MIDLEADIFNEIAAAASVRFPDLYLTSVALRTPPAFPCASLLEIDNSVYRRSQTAAGREHHAAITWEMNVYSAKRTGGKDECRRIAAFLDELLAEMNFTRILLTPLPNEDTGVYRICGRYRAVAGEDGKLYRN